MNYFINKIHGFGNDATGNGEEGCGAGIETWNGDFSLHDIDIIGNVVYNIGNKKTNDTLSQGIYCMNHGGNVSNNIVYDISGSGIQCWHSSDKITISNNLLFNNGSDGIVIGNGDSPGNSIGDYFTVTNNIVMNNKEYGISEWGAVGVHNVFENNLVYNNALGGIFLINSKTDQKNLDFLIEKYKLDVKSLTDSKIDKNTLNADPQFINFKDDGTGNYHVMPASPCINAGTTKGVPAIDYDGVKRPKESAVDIGPYEFTPGWLSKTDFSEQHILSKKYNGKETVEFDVTLYSEKMDECIGFSDSSVNLNSYSSMAVIIGIDGAGYFTARNGNDYENIAIVKYHENAKYHFRAVVNFQTKKYSVCL